MPLTDKLSVVTDAVYNRLLASKVPLGLNGVYYGDRDRFPGSPSVAVDPGKHNQDLVGAPFRVEARFVVYIMCYSAIISATDENLREAVLLSESICDVLRTDHTFGGILIYSMVDTVELGVATRGGQLTRASRITFSGISKYQLT